MISPAAMAGTSACRCLDEPAFAADLGSKARELVREQQGAADRTIGLLNGLLNPSATPAARSAA